MGGLKHFVNTSEDEQVKRVVRLYQRSTSMFRALPHFLVIGAMKAGTSSLYKYLVQHPQVLSSTKKEVHFFDWNFEKGPQWYKAHFPLKKNVPEGVQLGEASPIYIFDPRVPMRIKSLLPEVKLIAILRNPTERAISQYFQEVRKKREDLPILEAMQSEEQRISNALQQKDYDDYAYKYFSYKKRGIYNEQLSRYWEHFSKDQLLVLNSETFFAKPQETLRKIYEFLNIDTSIEIQDLAPKNVGKNREQVPDAVYEYLDDFFKPYNQALYKVIDQDFGW